MQSSPKIQSKFIFITGGVMSGLGKGVTTSSTAKLLQLAGYKVSCVKIDPYVNYDAGTMIRLLTEKSLSQTTVVSATWTSATMSALLTLQ